MPRYEYKPQGDPRMREAHCRSRGNALHLKPLVEDLLFALKPLFSGKYNCQGVFVRERCPVLKRMDPDTEK